MLKLICLLKCQTAFLVIKMKEFKSVIKCFYHQNSFRLLSWKKGRVYSRAHLINVIFINELKRWTELTKNWSELKRDVWSDWRDDMILSQRKQWFKTQFFIKIIIFKFLKVWLLSFFDSLMMSHLVIIRDETEQEAKLSFIITGLLCIIILIITSSTA